VAKCFAVPYLRWNGVFMLNGRAVNGVWGCFCRGVFCVRQRFGGVECDDERAMRGGDVYV